MEVDVMEKEIIDRGIKIKLVDGTQINAKVNIQRAPGYDRLSDIVASNKEPFLILFDTTSYHVSLDSPIYNETLFVNKDHIIWATPIEE